MIRLGALLLLLAALIAGAAPASAADPDLFERRYEYRFLDYNRAQMLVLNVCPAETPCRIHNGGKNILAVTTSAEVHKTIAQRLAERDRPPRTRAFNIVLLRADPRGEAAPSWLPESARQAVADLRGLLPHVRYELLDSAVVRSTERLEATVSGPRGVVYLAQITFRSDQEDELFVERFALHQLEGRRTASAGGNATTDAVPVPHAPASTEETSGPAPEAPTAGLNVLQTSFSMAVGETVVVGTSRLDGGDEAVVVLLTAVPSGMS